ncbi:AsmA-like C-terminal region-containing protein [Shimia sp. SDUM112013]|uniref:AsmA family protein n=1 Tax=Shimia sp. SDUM112013 TaxID=3136160 RepID=UPI0032F09B10
MSWITKTLLGLVALAGVLLIAGWMLLSSALFSDLRRTLVADVLSDQLGRDVVVAGDVQVVPGRILKLSAKGLTLPSATVADVTLAEVDRISFDLPLNSLWNKQPQIGNLAISGTTLVLVQEDDGSASWQNPTPKAPAPDKGQKLAPKQSIANVFTDRILRLEDTTLVYQSAINGLDLEMKLEQIALDRGDGTVPPTLTGAGLLNGESLTLSGRFPNDAPFTTALTFDGVTLSFDGTPAPDGYAAGVEVAMAADVVSIGQLLDILKLERALEGTGKVSAVLKHSPDTTRIDDLDVQVALDGGQSVVVTGQVGELGNPEDVSLFTGIRLYPEDAEPPVTKVRRDLKLISVDMEIKSEPGKVAQRRMVIETNGFVMDTSGEGPPPISVSQVLRTPEGKLRLGNVNLRLGPPAAPFVILDGAVADALNLEGISADGTISVRADSLLKPEGFRGGESLGTFGGDFHLEGNIDKLSLTSLAAKTHGTDLWDLTVTGAVHNVLRFEDVALEVKADVPSGADLLAAMSLKPIDTGEAVVNIALTSEGPDWNADMHIALGESVLDVAVDLDDAVSDPVVIGKVESDMIRMQQLRNVFSAAIQLRNIDDTPPMDDAPQALRDVTLTPLGRAVLLAVSDLEIALDLRHIEGAKGISTLQSEVTLKDRLLTAGPLKFEYGGGHFDVSGSMDLKDTKHPLEVKGKAGGWKLGHLLEELNFKKGASGTLYADFDVVGPTASVQAFLGALSGQGTVTMQDGTIETQLLDLAGLGVLPWLFSPHKKKVAPIVCLRAPIVLTNGKITTKTTVVETDQVQIVAYGDVDIPAKSINLHLQPRKIGEPLSRSPWPVSLTGALAKPKIKVKDGPKRLKRSDGADTMPAQRKRCVPDILQLQ